MEKSVSKIDTLTIKGFKSIRELDNLPLNSLNILIGANGVGKSNFISFFRMLNELVEGRMQVWTSKQGGADRILTYGVKETEKLIFEISFGNNNYNAILEPTVDDGFVFTHQSVSIRTSTTDHLNIKPFNLGDKESTLKKSDNEIALSCYNVISNWKVFHFHDTSETAAVKRLGALHDNQYLRPDASNLAAYLFKLKQAHANIYAEICKIVRLAIPFFDDFILNPTQLSSGEEQIRLLWKQLDSDYPLWPSQLSDGSIRFICLVTALLQPEPLSAIIIDEPELGLHPYAITLLGALLRSASERMQVIVSTQSVPLLNEFELNDLIIVERKENTSVFKRLENKQFENWLETYSVGELWEKNIIGGRPLK